VKEKTNQIYRFNHRGGVSFSLYRGLYVFLSLLARILRTLHLREIKSLVAHLTSFKLDSSIMSHCFVIIKSQKINQISVQGCLLDLIIIVVLLCLLAYTKTDLGRGYVMVKSKLDKAHREGAPIPSYHLIKTIFICTFPTFTVVSVSAGVRLGRE